MDERTANAVFDILVEVCGAYEDGGHGRDAFVRYLTEKLDWYEFRFMGRLGFGGKFHKQAWGCHVSCYPEDMTPARRDMVNEANQRIGWLLAGVAA